jgi:hypothetical protein
MRRFFAARALAIAGMLVAAPALPEDVVDRTSRPVRLLRSWDETVKAPNGREYVRRVAVVFDYGKGFAQERYSYGDDPRVYGRRNIKQSQPSPSPEEIAEAQDLVRQDPELGRIVARKNAVLEGGFILEEGKRRRCGPGSRCLQIQLLSPDREGLVRWTVVDLVKREIAYPVFVPVGIRQ